MIQAIHLGHLRNPEFIQFCNNFTSIVEVNDPAALSVQPQYNAMVTKTLELQGLFKNDIGSPMTAEIEALDFRRDQAVNGIISAFNTYSYHFDATIVNAAMLLQNNLKLYGAGIARENYQSETAIINKLVSDWESKTELASAISTLKLGSWVEELKTANDLFDRKYLDRTHEYAIAPRENQKSKRAEVMTVYYALRKRLDAFSTIESSAVYEKTINDLNALIEQYNTLLKGRKTPKATNTDVVSPV